MINKLIVLVQNSLKFLCRELQLILLMYLSKLIN